MGLVIGIDDAGRGPVLGPMVLAGVLIDSKDETFLKEIDAKDSKMLTPKKRRKIKEEIIQKFTNHIEVTTPSEIDESTNLNYLEAIKTAMIINKLTERLNEKVKVIVDCPSTNIKKWSNDVKNLLMKQNIVDLICEHKADFNHLVVSAASIIAKEKREEEIARLKRELGADFGSGYPSDPKTKEFLKKNVKDEKYKKLIRFSWATVKNIIEGRKQRNLL